MGVNAVKKSKKIEYKVKPQNQALLAFKKKQKNLTRRFFVEATQEIIGESGIESVSIRLIAKRTGYNSAMIYSYFKSLDYLITLSLMKYFREYLVTLSEHVEDSNTPLKNFYIVWEHFFDTCFATPKVFYSLFFVRHQEPLCDIVEQYYEIFPEEAASHTNVVQRMLKGRDIFERNLRIMIPIVESGDLPPEQLETINEIIVSYFKMLLESKCDLGNDADDSLLKSKLFAVIDLLLK